MDGYVIVQYPDGQLERVTGSHSVRGRLIRTLTEAVPDTGQIIGLVLGPVTGERTLHLVA